MDNSLFEIHSIISKKKIDNEIFYLVKWIGFPDPKDYTWEPKINLENAAELIRQFEKNQKAITGKNDLNYDIQTIENNSNNDLNIIPKIDEELFNILKNEIPMKVIKMKLEKNKTIFYKVAFLPNLKTKIQQRAYWIPHDILNQYFPSLLLSYFIELCDNDKELNFQFQNGSLFSNIQNI